MKTTALEYLRDLANSYAATEKVTISVSTLREALDGTFFYPNPKATFIDERLCGKVEKMEEKAALRAPIPSTGEMRHLAERLTETCCAHFATAYSHRLRCTLYKEIIDAPEIIALQQAADFHKRDAETLYQNCLRLQSENDKLKAAPLRATLTIEATMLEAGLQRVKKEILKHIHCRHGVRGDAHCVTCALDTKHEKTMADSADPAERDVVNVTEHIGKQGAYDSCTHNRAPDQPCPKCEPTAYDEMWDKACENNLHA